MRRRGPRIARATLRGMLLLGGVIAAWGAHDAILDDPAYAVDGPGPGIVGSLLDGAGAVVDGVLPGSPASPDQSATVDRSPAGPGAVGAPAPATGGTAGTATGGTAGTATGGTGTAGTRAPARAESDPAMRVAPVDLSPAVVPVGRLVERAAGPGVARAVEAVAPVTRPVVGAAVPVVEEIAGTGLLEPVDAVVRPVAEPIVETLAPILAPVLAVTRPILGQPANPVVPPGDPVVPPGEPRPGPAGAVPVTADPGVAGRSGRGPAVTPTFPAAGQTMPYRNLTMERRGGGGPADGAAADVSRGPGRGDGNGPGGLTPVSSGSAMSSASAGAGTATAADISPHPWMPELVSQRGFSSRCDLSAQRSPRPDTRPA